MDKGDQHSNIKSIRLLQHRNDAIEKKHHGIAKDMEAIKSRLDEQVDVDGANLAESKRAYPDAMNDNGTCVTVDLEAIHSEAESMFPGNAKLQDILTDDDWAAVDNRIAGYVEKFNARYALDRWDYAIAGGCGLFAAMLDLLFVRAPAVPTASWLKGVDGVFNRAVQEAFNHVLSPELSKTLGRLNTIGGADTSTVAQLVGAPPRTLNPVNHRLRALSHDPILGFLFGVLDMRRGTCSVIEEGTLKIYQTTKEPLDGGLFALLGRLFGHLLSDVNAPSSHGNRGMGLPAPFMGIIRMFDSVPAGESDLGKQVEYMYIKGYDFRQFVVTSVPILIMEVLMRVFYIVKQVKHTQCSLEEALADTVPGKMNPRFRIMLTMAYGTVAAVNGAKVHITENILDLNYAAWLGLIWNGFQAFKWALLDKSPTFWDEVTRREIESLERVVHQLEGLEDRAGRLPVSS